MSFLQMSLSGAVLVLVISLVRAAALYRLPKRIFPILWELAFLRLLLPFSIPSGFRVYAWIGASLPASGADGSISALPQQSPLIPAEQPAGSILWGIWLIGMLVMAAGCIAVYLHGLREFQTALPVHHERAKEWLEQHPLKRRITIRQSDRILAPLTYGILRPVILIPKEMVWEDASYMLAHEYVHIRRFDAAAKLIAAAVLCLHWFNPMVWVLYILFNRDIELACDECVIEQVGNAQDYARMLIRLEAQKSGLLPFGSNFGRNAIEERIKAMTKTKKSFITGGLALILVVAVLIAVSAAGRDSLTQLKESIAYQSRNIQFTIPDSDGPWKIRIYGRIELDGGGGMSVHYLEETEWESGQTYSFPVSDGGYTELYLDGENDSGAISIDLLELLPGGFSL